MLNIPAMPLYTFCAVKLNMWSWNQCELIVSRQSPGTFTMPPLSSGPPALGSVVSVVLVRRDGVSPEAAVLCDVEGELVAVAEEDRLAVAGHDQLGRKRPVVRPEREGRLVRQAWVEGRAEGSGSVDAGIEAGRHPGIVRGIDLGAFLRDLDGDCGRERGELLVRPDRPGRAAFDGAGVARPYALERGIQRLLGGVGLRRRGRA